MAKCWLPILWLVILCLAVACGDGGKEPATSTSPPPGTPQPTAVLQGTPRPTPIIVDGRLESPAMGYSVHIPEGWNAFPSYLPGPGFSIDAFFAPDLVEGVQPNIAVTCDQIPEGTTLTLKEYSDAKLQVARGVAQVEPDVSSGEVGGQEAVVARYKREKLEPAVEKTDVFFVTPKCGWTIALTVPLGHGSDYQGLFEEFLGSFRLLP